MQTISTRIPARTAAAQATIVRVLSGHPAPAQASTVAANALDWHHHQTVTPEPLAIPPMPAVSAIETEADEPGEAVMSAAAGNPFEAMMPSAARAAQPAANEEIAEDDGGSSNDLGAARGKCRGDEGRKLRRIVGPRLVRARALSGYSQTEAATALGYSTPAQVNLWEMGRRLPPIFELIKAAEIYSVSLDYLIGVSHEPDRDPTEGARHAILRGVRGMLERVAAITVGEIDRHQRLIGPHAGNVRGLLSAGDALTEAVGDFVRRNSTFEDQVGGATLLRRTHQLEAALAGARAAIRAHDSLDADLARALAALGDANGPAPEDDEV